MRHQRLLMVCMTGGPNTQPVASRRIDAIGADQQLALELAAVARADANSGIAGLDCGDTRLDEHHAGGARRALALLLQGSALDNEPQIRLAQFGAVEGHRTQAGRLAAGIPDAHAFVGAHFLRGQELPYTAQRE